MAHPPRKRIHSIDYFRILAAASVMLHHFILVGYTSRQTTYVFAPLIGIAKYGYLGVPLAFVLSGFVISMSADGRSSSQFAAARFMRIFPAFWLACTLTFVSCRLFGAAVSQVGVRDYLVNLTMLQRLVGLANVDAVYWTLLDELKFYCALWLILKVEQFDNLERVLRFLFGLSAIAYLKHGHFFDIVLLFPGMDQLPYFIAGALYYLAYKEGWNRDRAMLAAGTILLSCLWSIRTAGTISMLCHVVVQPVVVCSIVLMIHGLFLAISMGWDVKHGANHAAALTYPVYLVHARVGYILLDRIAPGNRTLPKLFLVCFLVILLAALIHEIEKRAIHHAKQILDNWRSVRKPLMTPQGARKALDRQQDLDACVRDAAISRTPDASARKCPQSE